MSRAPLGVFSSQTASAPAMGARRPQKRLWLVWEHDAEHVVVQPINKNLVPIGKKQLLSRQEFEESYQSEPEFVIEKGEGGEMRPIWRAQDVAQKEAAQPAEQPRQPGRPRPFPDDETQEPPGKPFSIFTDEEEAGKADGEGRAGKVVLDELVAEPEPGEVEPPPSKRGVELDLEREKREQAHKRRMEAVERAEREARTAFGLGISHLRRGNKERAEKIFSDLAGIEGEFAPEHKHMFNEFGISLRKSDLPDLSLRHYFRALQLSPGDENLHHNIARVYWEKGDMRNCALYLRKSLDLNPDMEYSQRFLRFLEKHKKRRKGLFSDLLPLPKRNPRGKKQ